MKVIKIGNNRNFTMRIKCMKVVDRYGFSYGKEKDFCGSLLEIDENDIKKHSWSKYPDYHGVDYGVICPVCGKFIMIKVDTIPQRYLDNIEEIQLG